MLLTKAPVDSVGVTNSYTHLYRSVQATEASSCQDFQNHTDC